MIAILAAAALAWTPGEPPHDGRWVEFHDAYTPAAGSGPMRWLAKPRCMSAASPGWWQTWRGEVYLTDAAIRDWRPVRLKDPRPSALSVFGRCSNLRYPRTKP